MSRRQTSCYNNRKECICWMFVDMYNITSVDMMELKLVISICSLVRSYQYILFIDGSRRDVLSE